MDSEGLNLDSRKALAALAHARAPIPCFFWGWIVSHSLLVLTNHEPWRLDR
jgi:hypothetical protein